jgi:hypothetical protein
VKPLSESSCYFTDSISMSETEDYLAFVEKSGASPEQASVTEAKERLLVEWRNICRADRVAHIG